MTTAFGFERADVVLARQHQAAGHPASSTSASISATAAEAAPSSSLLDAAAGQGPLLGFGLDLELDRPFAPTGLSALDALLNSSTCPPSSSAVLEDNIAPDAVRPPASAVKRRRTTAVHPRILEITGPTSSGKSAFVVRCAVVERLRGLRTAWLACAAEDAEGVADQAEGGRSVGNHGQKKGRRRRRRKMTRREWDEEVTGSAPQVMLIDTEGACTPERLFHAAKHVITADADARELVAAVPLRAQRSDRATQRHDDEEDGDEHAKVMALIEGVLQGIQLCRPATLAQFIATIMLIDPHLSNGLRARTGGGSGGSSARPSGAGGSEGGEPSAVSDGGSDASALALSSSPAGAGTPPAPTAGPAPATGSAILDAAQSYSSLPPRTSLLLIDSLSAFLRAPPTQTKAGREERAHVLGVLAALGRRVRRYNQACAHVLSHQSRSQGGGEGGGAGQGGRSNGGGRRRLGLMLDVVVTLQMGVKVVPPELDPSESAFGLASWRSGGGGGGNVAVLVPQLQVIVPASSSSFNPSTSTGAAGFDPSAKGGIGGSGKDDASAHLIGAGRSASVLGEEVWRVVLFRAGAGGHRFAQLYQLPRSIEASILNGRAALPVPDPEQYLIQTRRWVHYIVDSKSGLPREPPT